MIALIAIALISYYRWSSEQHDCHYNITEKKKEVGRICLGAVELFVHTDGTGEEDVESVRLTLFNTGDVFEACNYNSYLSTKLL